MMDLDGAFLTEVVDQLKARNWNDPHLSGVRKEYVRVMEVIEAFGDKVNDMVDRSASYIALDMIKLKIDFVAGNEKITCWRMRSTCTMFKRSCMAFERK